MKKNIFPALLLFIVALVSVGLIFVFNESYQVHTDTIAQVLYWSSKVFSLLTLVFIGMFFYQKVEVANTIILGRLTILWQFIPLIMRFMLRDNAESANVILPTIIFVIALLGYIAIFFLLIESNKRIKEKMPELEGKIKPIADSESYYDENNNFVGANVEKEDEDE